MAEPEPTDQEYEVGVSFFGSDFVLTVVWTTDPTSTDEARIDAAAEWFADEYGFDPRQHMIRADVKPLAAADPEESGSVGER